jgi:hypothetical protein
MWELWVEELGAAKTWLRLLYGLIQLMETIMNDGFGTFCEFPLNI